MIVQYTPKEWVKQDPEKIISEFSDTLLETSLRDTLEKENRVIREAIITKALYWVHEEPEENFTPTIDLWDPNKQESTLDFDRDIEDIIKEIENDPDLQIDEDEIQKMLDEIENDTSNSPDLKPTFTVDPSHIDSIKDQFKKKQ